MATAIDSRGGEKPSLAVIRALADAEDTTPEALPITLWDYVDPEALDTIAAGNGCTVRFSVEEYDVTVTSAGGRVAVELD
jgi:hypothetical protein